MREVTQLLGEPEKIFVTGDTTWWYYGSPGGGKVDFTNDRVNGWSEP